MAEYESRFDFELERVLFWGEKGGRQPPKGLGRCIRPPAATVRSTKVALHSCQRYTQALGDLNRYRKQYASAVDGRKEFFRRARKCVLSLSLALSVGLVVVTTCRLLFSWYNCGIQLSSTSGHLFNQLGLLAFQTVCLFLFSLLF